MRRALLGCCLAWTVACGAPPASSSTAGRSASNPSRVGEAVPSVHVLPGLDSRPALAPVVRDPFRFGAAAGASAGEHPRAMLPLPPPDGLPELPLPLAATPLRLLGVITLADGAKQAVVSVGGDLVLARAGEVIGGRFRVVTIGADAVEMTDTVGNRTFSLALP